MPVRFVLGRAGTGKTHHCFDVAWEQCRQRGLDANVLLLLPPQGTFMAERRLACESKQTLTGVQVVSFDSLVRELSGQDTRLTVSAQGRRLVLSHLLRQNVGKLKYFGKSATQPHLAGKIDAALSELESAGLMVDDIDAPSANSGDGTLSNKLDDLKLLYGQWQAFLGQEKVDPARRLREAALRIEKHPAIKGAVVLVDGFAGFSALQRHILLAMVRGGCRQMDICLMMDAASPVIAGGVQALDELSLFHRSERAFLRLRDFFAESGITLAEPLRLATSHRPESDDLSAIERHWGLPQLGEPKPPSSIVLIEADTAQGEVRVAARQIRQWQMEGMRLRDIGVLARSLADYRPWVSTVLAEYDIPCFFDQRRPMAYHALLRLVRSVLQIARLGWQQELVLDLLKCGLLPLESLEADLLENFALRHGIDRGKWVAAEPWNFSSSPSSEDAEPHQDDQTPEALESRQCESLRCRVLMPIARFMQELQIDQPDVRAQAALLVRLLSSSELGIRDRLNQWIDRAAAQGDTELAAEHARAWQSLMDLLEEMVYLLGAEHLPATDFAQTLEAALEGFTLALTPPTVDQVLVGQVDRSRSPEFRALIVLGMNDGLFPLVPPEDAIFSDAERKLLTARGIDIEPDSGRLAMDESLMAYIALTRPSQRLVLTRHTTDDAGRPTIPSPYLGKLERLVGLQKLTVDQGPLSTWTVSEAAMSIAQARRGEAAWPAARALHEWLLGCGIADLAIRAAAAGAQYHNKANLDRSLASQLLQSPLRASVSRIECYASCPFKHFARYTLRLKQREIAKVTNIDLGNVYHHVLEKLVHCIVDQKMKWSDPKLDDLIPTLAQEAAATLRGQLMLSTQRNQYLLSYIQKTLGRIIDDQRRLEAAGEFQPAGAEISFGFADSEVPALSIEVPGGRLVQLWGKIDRVDVVEHQAVAAVYDYKLNGASLRLSHVYHGLALQLLTYLLVVKESGLQIAGKPLTPAGAFYLQLQRKLKSEGKPPGEFDEDKVEAKPRGIFDMNWFESFDRHTTAGDSGIVAHQIKKDGAPGKRDTTDSAQTDEFAGVLEYVRRRIGEMAGDMLDGKIDIEPYMIGTSTPCPWCEYKSMCRFEPSHGYNELASHSRMDVLSKVKSAPGGDHA